MNKPMKIYLASRYSRNLEMQLYRKDLEILGHSVTSRWINGNHQITHEDLLAGNKSQKQMQFAQEDYEDLCMSDCVISFTETPREFSNSRGGRHVEYGIALALKKRIIIIGYRENIFHHLPETEFFISWGDAIKMFMK